jgi:hypothetical protein
MACEFIISNSNPVQEAAVRDIIDLRLYHPGHRILQSLESIFVTSFPRAARP